MPKRSSISPKESSATMMGPSCSKPRTMKATSKKRGEAAATELAPPVRRSKRLTQKLDALQHLGETNLAYRDRREDDSDEDDVASCTRSRAPKILRTPSTTRSRSRSRSRPKSRSGTPTSSSSSSSAVRWTAPSFKEIEGRLKFDENKKQIEDKSISEAATQSTEVAEGDSFESMVASLGTLSISGKVPTRRRRSSEEGRITSTPRRQRLSLADDEVETSATNDEMLRIECNNEEAVVHHVVSKEPSSPRRSSRFQTTSYANKKPATRSRSKSPSAAARSMAASLPANANEASANEYAEPSRKVATEKPTNRRRSMRLQRKRNIY